MFSRLKTELIIFYPIVFFHWFIANSFTELTFLVSRIRVLFSSKNLYAPLMQRPTGALLPNLFLNYLKQLLGCLNTLEV